MLNNRIQKGVTLKLPLPSNVLAQTSGAYLVGGSVRDLICGRRPADYDIAVIHNAKGYAQKLAAKLKGRMVAIGKQDFPLYRVVKTPLIIDVTPVKGKDIAADLSDRDFTINALACELSTGNVIDTTGGVADIEQGVVRMVSAQAFQKDPVRLVRAYRMAARFDYHIESTTADTIASRATDIQSCAGERVWTELALILACPNSFHQIQQMVQSGLLTAIFPELSPLKGCHQSEPHHLDVFEHTLLAFQSLEKLLSHPPEQLNVQMLELIQTFPIEQQALLKLALLLHDVGKANQRTIDDLGKIHFYGHASASAKMAEPILQRLRLSKRQANWVEFIIANHSRPHDLFLLKQKENLTPKAIGNFLRHCGADTPHLTLHAIADNLGKDLADGCQPDALLAFFNQLLDAYFKTAEPKESPPLLGGQDLMATFNLKPSPLIGALMKGIEEARLAGTISHRRQALEWANNYLTKKGWLDE